MTVADNIKPYPAGATYEVWNAAKTEGVRDKFSTDLGQALRRAKISYDKLKWDKLDVERYIAKNGEFGNVAAVETAARDARMHLNTVLVPAIRDLESAKTKATAAGKNVVISKARNAKAKEIAAALAEPLRVLKAIHLQDFDAEKQRMEKA